ncbi:MAG: class I SAM-dependent methyltransferase [Caulobacterales bacterium]|nr:class I SAM-dependent methyltransferase [Caulobacterales bacterium]
MPTLLHVGCARLRKDATTPAFAGPDWDEVRLDIDPAVEPDIVASMTDMSAVPNGAMDAVYSSHNLEHLYPFEVEVALKEFARVLGPDGFAVVTCPDLQATAQLVLEDRLLETAYESPAGPISALDILYGHRAALARGNLFMAHRCGFTARALSQVLRGCGFGSVIVRRRPAHFDIWAVATRASAAPERLRALAAQHFPADSTPAAAT